MKKKEIKGLYLNKKIVSNFETTKIIGGNSIMNGCPDTNFPCETELACNTWATCNITEKETCRVDCPTHQ